MRYFASCHPFSISLFSSPPFCCPAPPSLLFLSELARSLPYVMPPEPPAIGRPSLCHSDPLLNFSLFPSLIFFFCEKSPTIGDPSLACSKDPRLLSDLTWDFSCLFCVPFSFSLSSKMPPTLRESSHSRAASLFFPTKLRRLTTGFRFCFFLF